MKFLNRILGDPNKRVVSRMQPMVDRINGLEPDFEKLSDEDMLRKTEEFKKRRADGESLDDLLPEAFSLVRESAKRTLAQRHYDVQLMGGLVLHHGQIAEMRTGEGKTLVSTLAVYLNALSGKGVHVVTVNDYLAKRDAQWMGLLYEALGLTVGTIVHGLNHEQRQEAYACDVTYGTNNEFGFDYLRDNMATSVERQVQRGLHYAIVDEVDSILVDEARTPLIISQPGDESTDKYKQYAQVVQNLRENVHFNRDEKQKVAMLTEEGIKKMEEILGVKNIYTDRGFEEVHHIEQALRAYAIYERDVDYVVKDNEVIIVDEFTGRLMPGRRYGHGLHQAIEAKEGVEVQRESKTLATITFQNYFRLFEKLAGMTGTAKTEEEEFESIYKLRTVVIPTDRPLIRDDRPDAIYRTVAAKFKAVAKIAQEKHEKGQPILVGTTSVEKSEALSALLNQQKIPHQVLNAKHHEKEADIVAQAGHRGAVTIATNMAGRGTDIKLGEGVVDLGGLCILGTERHEARRIDNQLRGRSGRQGDPGESQFFVSMEDDLMRLFGGERLKGMMERLKVPDDVPLENRMVSKSIESAQKRVEGHNFDIRRHVVRYDDIMNQHRGIIYTRRQKILVKLAEGEEADTEEVSPLHQDALDAMQREVETVAQLHGNDVDTDNWNMEEIKETISALHPEFADAVTPEKLQKCGTIDGLKQYLTEIVQSFYEEKCAQEDPSTVSMAERVITLQSIDTHWMDHIDDMAHLREQVSFAGFAQRDPLIEYKDQGFRRFQQLLASIDSTIVHTLIQQDFTQFSPRILMQQAEDLADLQTNEDQIAAELTQTGAARKDPLKPDNPVVIRADGEEVTPQMAQMAQQVAQPRQVKKVGRNDPCPCGSGKKYKKCHGNV